MAPWLRLPASSRLRRMVVATIYGTLRSAQFHAVLFLIDSAEFNRKLNKVLAFDDDVIDVIKGLRSRFRFL